MIDDFKDGSGKWVKHGYVEGKKVKTYSCNRWDNMLSRYERLKASEFVVDERVVERMRAWKFEGES